MSDIPPPPAGWQRISLLGPGFLWMVSAAGSGELLERTATFIGVGLAAAALAAAVSVGFSPGELAGGLTPGFPDDVDYGEVLPWLGFMLAGAAGLVWYLSVGEPVALLKIAGAIEAAHIPVVALLTFRLNR
jgi:hypothetical protein